MSSDTFKILQKQVAKFVFDRDWDKFHNPKNLAMSIAIEASEIMELFQWKSLEESLNSINNPKFKQELTFELADVLIYILSLSYRTNIDLKDAVMRKLEINNSRFPEKVVHGILPPEK